MNVAVTDTQGGPRSQAIDVSPEILLEAKVSASPELSTGEESTVIASNTRSNLALNIDLNDVFYEMEAQPVRPVLPVQLIPLESTPPNALEESPKLFANRNVASQSRVEEPKLTRTSKTETLDVLDETLKAFAADEAGGEVFYGGSTVEASRQSDSIPYVAKDVMYTLTQEPAAQSSNEYSLGHGNISVLGSSNVAENVHTDDGINEETVPERQSELQKSRPHTSDMRPPLDPDIPPALPNTLPPSVPSVSPPSVMHSDLDEDIEALLAGEISQNTWGRDTGDLILEREIQATLESDVSSLTSDSNPVVSVDSLYTNQTAPVYNAKAIALINQSARVQNTEVCNDFGEMRLSSIDDDVTSDDVSEMNGDDVVCKRKDRRQYANSDDCTQDTQWRGESKSAYTTHDSQTIWEMRNSPVNRVCESEDSESSDVREIGRKPPPVLAKPKYCSQSMNLSREKSSSMTAQRDMIDGCFPPAGLVPKRASEFNIGECDLLREKIVYLERQLKV